MDYQMRPKIILSPPVPSLCPLCRASDGDVPSKHLARIICENAKGNPIMVNVLGGPSVEESERIINEHKGHKRN
jgi:hypothetical protein